MANERVEIDDLSKKNTFDPFTYMADVLGGMSSITKCDMLDSLPQNDSAALIEVDFPVLAGPLHTTTGHPENNCDKNVI